MEDRAEEPISFHPVHLVQRGERVWGGPIEIELGRDCRVRVAGAFETRGLERVPEGLLLTLLRAVRIYLAAKPVDLRRGFDGLAATIRSLMGANPLSGHVFVVLNRRRDRVKLLVWDRFGWLVVHKRLERHRIDGE